MQCLELRKSAIMDQSVMFRNPEPRFQTANQETYTRVIATHQCQVVVQILQHFCCNVCFIVLPRAFPTIYIYKQHEAGVKLTNIVGPAMWADKS